MSAVDMVAELMVLAAKTAPKSGGSDYIVTKVLGHEELSRLANEMKRYGIEAGKKNFDRDGENVRNSEAVVLIGLKEADVLDLNCGACGEDACILPNAHEGPEFKGPNCALRLLDMGIAIGSAVKVAMMLNVDNRVMYRIGVLARRMGYIDADFVMGIPLAASGKNPFFDR